MRLSVSIGSTKWLFSEEPHQESHQKYHRFLQHFARYCNVILCVCPVILELVWGSLRFPGTLYRLLFLCFSLGPIRGSLSAIIPTSWVNGFTSAVKAAYGRIRSAGGNAKNYVLGLVSGA